MTPTVGAASFHLLIVPLFLFDSLVIMTMLQAAPLGIRRMVASRSKYTIRLDECFLDIKDGYQKKKRPCFAPMEYGTYFSRVPT